MVLHADGNSFYASCEQIYRPDLRGKPVAVLSNNDGIIIALNKEAIKQGMAKSTNPRLDVSILVSGLWGCIESVLLKKSEPDYWEKGNAYTDRFIKLWINSIFVGDEK